jgi:hypothetical protein
MGVDVGGGPYGGMSEPLRDYGQRPAVGQEVAPVRIGAEDAVLLPSALESLGA